jgi:hypothetical protein
MARAGYQGQTEPTARLKTNEAARRRRYLGRRAWGCRTSARALAGPPLLPALLARFTVILSDLVFDFARGDIDRALGPLVKFARAFGGLIMDAGAKGH